MSAAVDSRAEALNRALAAEHAAVYVYGVLGAQTSQSDHPRLSADLAAAYRQHRDARDALVGRVVAAGGTPAASAPAYALPNAAAGPDQVFRAARLTEARMTQTYGTLVAETTGGDRRWAIGSLDESAVRQLRFRGSPENFPGTTGPARRMR